MKVTINNPEDSIDLSQVTEDMYFVATNEGKAIGILTKRETAPWNFCFVGLNRITHSNEKWFHPKDGSLSGTISEWVNLFPEREVHAFRTYQEAFKFIAENL